MNIKEYIKQKEEVEAFESSVTLAMIVALNLIARVRVGDAKAEIEPYGTDFRVILKKRHDGTVLGWLPWVSLKAQYMKSKWVVEMKDIYCNKEYRICDTKLGANKEYRELRGREDIDYLEEPVKMTWDEISALDPSDRNWC
jgi:hypothetical protein